MEKIRTFPFRYTFYAVSLARFFASLMAAPVLGGWFYLVPLLFRILSVLGTWGLLQTQTYCQPEANPNSFEPPEFIRQLWETKLQ